MKNKDIQNYAEEPSPCMLSEYFDGMREIGNIQKRIAAHGKELQDRTLNALYFLTDTDGVDGNGERVYFRTGEWITSFSLSEEGAQVTSTDGYNTEEYFVPMSLILTNDLATRYEMYIDTKNSTRKANEQKEAALQEQTRRALYEQLKKEFERSGSPDKDW